MKIVIFNMGIVLGGIEKCIELLNEHLKEDYELEIVYLRENTLNEKVLNILSKNAKVHKLDSVVEADICILCNHYFNYSEVMPYIKAKKYISWVHTMPKTRDNFLLNENSFIEKIDKIVCVSEAVKSDLIDEAKEKAIVIHNFIAEDIYDKSKLYNPFENYDGLKLVVVSRISIDKGFDRLKILIMNLEEKNVDYKLLIVGTGVYKDGRSYEEVVKDNFSTLKNVEFVGYKENPYPYIKNADYLIQLSPDESWCNSISEAKTLGTPCIITNFKSSVEQIKDDENGVILPLNLECYINYIDDIVNKKDFYKDNLKNFSYKNEIDKWKVILR